jgi:hypothetical protein
VWFGIGVILSMVMSRGRTVIGDGESTRNMVRRGGERHGEANDGVGRVRRWEARVRAEASAWARGHGMKHHTGSVHLAMIGIDQI